ncbi:MAG: 3-deoxy-8-phosphooctulonate synthase [Planctomycetota bacterium]
MEGNITVGDGAPLLVIGGPCVIEDRDTCLRIAHSLRGICDELGLQFVFKSSFDKANRTSIDSYRGPGLEDGLRILGDVREECGVPVLSDIHEPWQAEPAGEVLDIVQVPAFLCRQTDLLLAAGETGLPVNIKKGQFMAPGDMAHAADKVRSRGNDSVMLCERGTTFGYGELVVDMRSIPRMKAADCPVVFDATHATQRPSGRGGRSGGEPEMAPVLASAAVAAGADGLFVETHPEPDEALSDSASMLPLDEVEDVLRRVRNVYEVSGGRP